MWGYSRFARYWLPAKYSNLGNQTTKNNKKPQNFLISQTLCLSISDCSNAGRR